jgi:DNA polymerase I-like protein with 3'-5' exonuclease and polymerase domains
MIYLLGNEELFSNEDYKVCKIEDVFSYFKDKHEIFLDTETMGFDPFTKRLLTLQLGDFDNQFVIDVEYYKPELFKELIESKLILGQNLKFDLRFLYYHGIFPKIVYDTYLAERVITLGDKFAKKNLGALGEKYAHTNDIDKSQRGLIHREGLTARVIKYCAMDCKYLGIIRDKQIEQLYEKKEYIDCYLQNLFVRVLAYIEYSGIKLDSEKWLEKCKKDKEHYNKCVEALNTFLIQNNITKFIDNQLSLFDENVNTRINWASSKQVIELFEHLGMNVTIVDQGVSKKSVEDGVVAKLNHPIIPLYREYSKAAKLISTYGETVLKHINKATGRIHTNFNQIMDTGRLSSGGKNKDNGAEYINLQNIPSDPFTRSCFIAEKGNTLIISDYSGQEQIILANKCLDANILKFYDEGLADMHSFVASKMYPELEGLTLDEVKEKHKKKRQFAKSAGFAINYGGTGITIAENLNIPKEDGDKIYDSYFKAFPGLRAYFDRVKKESIDRGYILISQETGLKYYFPTAQYEEYSQIKQQLTREFWKQYRANKTADKVEKVKKYFRLKGDFERKSLNYPVQGLGATITKLSCVYIFEYIEKNNLFNTVKFVNTVHDENVLEVPLELAEQMSKVVEESMNRAADVFCKRVKLTATPELSVFWCK